MLPSCQPQQSLNTLYRAKSAKTKAASGMKEEAVQQTGTQTTSGAYYNVHEELAGKYGKSHVFKLKTMTEFDEKVVQYKYPVVVLYYKE